MKIRALEETDLQFVHHLNNESLLKPDGDDVIELKRSKAIRIIIEDARCL